GGGRLDAELLEACAVEGQRLRPGVLRDAVGLSVAARLTPDALVELRLYLGDVLADLGGDTGDDHRRQRGVLDEGDVRGVARPGGGDELGRRIVTAAGIGVTHLDVGVRRVPGL